MKGFYIDVSNGLLKNGHRQRMGEAVWEFMWCLDHITKIDEDGYGWVLGGKTINLKHIADGYYRKDGEWVSGFKVHKTTVSRNLNHLQNEQYIEIIRQHDGIVIKVLKAKKRFSRYATRFSKDAKSYIYRDIQKRELEELSSEELRKIVQ